MAGFFIQDISEKNGISVELRGFVALFDILAQLH
jgi:hypothetical protein